MNKKEYQEYLKSKEWKAIKKRKLAESSICEMRDMDIRYSRVDFSEVVACDGLLHIHHKTYERVGDELLCDLMVLCEHHHKEVHERENLIKKRNKKNRAINTFARKKYGSDWLEYIGYETVRDEFNRWLERKSW